MNKKQLKKLKSFVKNNNKDINLNQKSNDVSSKRKNNSASSKKKREDNHPLDFKIFMSAMNWNEDEYGEEILEELDEETKLKYNVLNENQDNEIAVNRLEQEIKSNNILMISGGIFSIESGFFYAFDFKKEFSFFKRYWKLFDDADDVEVAMAEHIADKIPDFKNMNQDEVAVIDYRTQDVSIMKKHLLISWLKNNKQLPYYSDDFSGEHRIENSLSKHSLMVISKLKKLKSDNKIKNKKELNSAINNVDNGYYFKEMVDEAYGDVSMFTVGYEAKKNWTEPNIKEEDLLDGFSDPETYAEFEEQQERLSPYDSYLYIPDEDVSNEYIDEVIDTVLGWYINNLDETDTTESEIKKINKIFK